MVRKTIIGDDSERLAKEIRQARQSSGLVILTGGLGPTLDDVTRYAASNAVDCALMYHDHIVELIRERFVRRGRKMAEVNRRQGYILAGADILANANGTAPGQWLEDREILRRCRRPGRGQQVECRSQPEQPCAAERAELDLVPAGTGWRPDPGR